MRANIRTWFTALIIIVVGAGCATTEDETTGLERSDRAINSMETVYEDIKTTLTQINAVESSLRNLTRAGQSDAKTAYETYSNDVSELEASSKRLLDNKEDMNDNVEAYFSGWQNEGEEYENQRLQELSTERRSELRNTFEDVKEEGDEIDNNLSNYISDLKEVRQYLSNDLTTAGIESIQSLADDINDNSESITTSLNNMQDALEEALSEMARR